MLKKVLLSLAILVTAANVAAVAVYAGVCQSSGGARACGTTCATQPGGTCVCEGSCSADELNWVAGAGGRKVATAGEIPY